MAFEKSGPTASVTLVALILATTLFMDSSVAVDMTFCHNGCEKFCETSFEGLQCYEHCKNTFCQVDRQHCIRECCIQCQNQWPYRTSCLESCGKQFCNGIPKEGPLKSRRPGKPVPVKCKELWG